MEHSVDVKPSYGLTDQQVEAMILESFDKAEEDFRQRQVREAQVEADAVLGAVEKARKDDAYFELTEEERAAVDHSINELLVVYNADDHSLIRAKIDQVDVATQKLAEIIMNNAVGQALKGTKIDE
jgi:molecular chaperone DnaK (HSP70)